MCVGGGGGGGGVRGGRKRLVTLFDRKCEFILNKCRPIAIILSFPS